MQISLYLVGLLLVIIALAQTTLSPRLTLLGVQSNLMLLAVLSWSLLRGRREGMVWAFGGGMLLDMLSGASFGISTLSLLLVSSLAGLGEVTIFRVGAFRETPLLPLPLVASFAGSLLHDLTFLTILQLMGWAVDWPTALWRLMLPSAGLNTALMPPVYLLLRWLDRRTKEAGMVW